MGWTPGKSLGSSNSGIKEPVSILKKNLLIIVLRVFCVFIKLFVTNSIHISVYWENCKFAYILHIVVLSVLKRILLSKGQMIIEIVITKAMITIYDTKSVLNMV